MEIRRGNASKAVLSVLRQKDILTNLLNDSGDKGATDQSKLKQKLLAAMLILRSWTNKHESIMEKYEIERLNVDINELQMQLIHRNNNHRKIGHKNKEKVNREKLKIAEKIKLPPEQMFLQDPAYSKFDSNGFPLADHNNLPLTKSKIKRLRKMQMQHGKRHLKWLAKSNV